MLALPPTLRLPHTPNDVGYRTECEAHLPWPPALFPFSHVGNPNDLWCADFKGHFTVGNGQRCDPLTITDAHTRYLLQCKAVPATNTESVQKVFEKVSQEFGIAARHPDG